MLRHPKIKGTQEPDLSKSPTLTIKIPCWNKVWKPEIYDEEGEPLFVSGKVNAHSSPLEYIKPKAHVIALIQCGGLWFINGKVSITWNLKQAIVQTPKASMEGQCLLKPKSEDKQKLKTLPLPEDVDPDGGVVTTFVEDSDEEEDLPPPILKIEPVVVQPPPPNTQEQEVVAEETVESKPKKKVVRKKDA